MRILPWLFSVSFLLAGPVVAADGDGANSGFLGDSYSRLEDARSPSGHKVRRWISPALGARSYEALLLERTVLWPQPSDSAQLSVATLNEIAACLDETLARELGAVLTLSPVAGARTLRFRPAITAVAGKDMGFKAYQLLPIAFIATLGRTTKKATLSVEYQILDAESGEVLAAGMREDAGEDIGSVGDRLTLDSVRPAIERWARDARAFVEAARSGK